MKAKKVLILGSKEFFSLWKNHMSGLFKSLGLNVSLFHVYRIKKSNLEKNLLGNFLNLFCFTFLEKK